jgi:anti-sigma28 factor (negative regulator of flagellin synthesis)
MRLQLDTSVSSASETAQTAPAASGARNGSRGGDASPGDSISVSSPSSALNALSSERNVRIEQLSATVRSGQYQVSSAALSSAIIGQAFS